MCGRKTCDVEPTEGSDLGEINPFCDAGECVGVCFKSYRSDLFSFQESRQGDLVGCSMQTEQKRWATEFHRGSTNVRKLEFKIGEKPSSPEGVGDDTVEAESLDYCELSVDGVACNSCAFCGAFDTAELDIDCTNIVPGAITNCGSLQDLYYGIVHKLLVVDEGATHEPTEAPTTLNPTAPEVQVERTTGSGATESETNEIIGLASSASRFSIAVLLFLGSAVSIFVL
jgi:hypothetical protein